MFSFRIVGRLLTNLRQSLIFRRVPSECFHATVLTESQSASPQGLRAKKERNHVFADELAHVKDIRPCLALLGRGFVVRISVTRQTCAFVILMNGALSDSSTFFADGLRGCDLPAGVGVGDAETIAAITSNSALTFGIIAFMYFTFQSEGELFGLP